MKKTLVLGASTNPERYSNIATERLLKYGHEVVPVGIKSGVIHGLNILTGKPEVKDIDTVTLYLNPQNQTAYYDYILSLKPKRIIFNPGAENPELTKLASQKGIETLDACTLVLLATNQY